MSRRIDKLFDSIEHSQKDIFLSMEKILMPIKNILLSFIVFHTTQTLCAEQKLTFNETIELTIKNNLEVKV